MVRKTFSTNVDGGGVNAVATNKEANLVVVAGRNVLKIYEIRDDSNSFSEKINLRVGKNLNLNYSTNDVAWNHLEENILATAASNGAVVVWNLDRSNSRNKFEQSFLDHRRTVNKVCWHPTEPHLLLSGSQDGTMKLFDLRKKETANTFLGLSESVRDVQFSPHHDGRLFCAVQENGNVQLWDLRKSEQPERQFTAHSGPVFSCDWHLDDRKMLATGGRDRTIKVWDLSKKPNCEYCISTIAPVARVRWRPQRRNNIGSSSLVVDFSIYIWDVDRPYVPFAAFMEHRDVATAFVWRNDPHTIISAGKDATLYQHAFKDAQRPANLANNHGLDVNNKGDICFALSDFTLRSHNSSNSNGYALNSTSSVAPLAQFYTEKINPFRKQSDLTEKFKCASSSVRMFISNFNEKNLSMDWFILFALRYRLVGKPFPELCEHNASVALELERPQIAQTWRIIRQLYFSLKSNGSSVDERNFDGSEPRSRHVSKGTTAEPRNEGRLPSVTSLNSLWTGTKFLSEAGDLNDAFEGDKPDTSAIVGSFDNQSGFFFGEEETAPVNNFTTDFELAPSETLLDGLDETKMFTDSFLRNPIDESYLLSEIDVFSDHSKSSFAAAAPYTDETSLNTKVGIVMHDENDRKMLPSNLPPIPPWKFSDIVVEVLQYYANQGDIQTTVSILIVLGERIKGCVDENLQEFWVHSYIDLLSRFQLWNIVNQIIRACCIPNINGINQTSTTVYTSCGKCQRASIGKVGWLCDRCKALPSQCAICHEIVKGLYVWCQGCSHGGHLQHISDWLKIDPRCPSGCGHLCEYT